MNPRTCLTVGALLTLTLLPAAWAQLPGLPDPIEDTIERTVQTQTERAQEQAQQQAQQIAEQAAQISAEQAVQQTAEQAQQAVERATEIAGATTGERILDQLPDPVSRVTERLPDVAERVQQQLPNVVEQAQARLEELAESGVSRALERVAILGPLDELPERLEILDRQGDQAFTEIQIGEQTRALDAEWLMLLTPDQLALLESEAQDLLEYQESAESLDGLGGTLVRFRVPDELDTEDAIRRLVPEPLRDRLDRNLIYTPQAENAAGDTLGVPMQAVCDMPVSIGMIDSAIEAQHPAFANKVAGDLITRSFLNADIEQPPGHGTAVAGMLIGRGQKLEPLLPRGKLYAASVVYSQGTYHRGATLAHLLNALNWLAQRDLRVINMSLTGPPSSSLEMAIGILLDQGKLVVAAAGNDGPHSGPRYPAAYPGVIAVTAVEPDRRIYPWANQGDYIDFAALGVSIVTARAHSQFGVESGTSMASPVVAAFVACALADSETAPSAALQSMQQQAVDLGEPGYDPVFGHGLLHP